MNGETSKLRTTPREGANGSDPPGVRVLTIDDQPVFRRVARDVIEATPGFEPVGEATSGEQALSIIGDLHPDLILIDIRMPGMDGLETARRISEAHPEPTIVLITIEEPEEVSSSFTASGAVALIRKQDFGPAKLRAVWRKHGRVSPER